MPWPYLSSRGKTRAGLASSSPSAAGDPGDMLIGALSLGEGVGEEMDSSRSDGDRRAASLDVARSSLNSLTALPPTISDKPKARRSSFPRLALPSWRQSSGPSSPSSPLTRTAGTSSPSKSTRSSRRQSLAIGEDEEEGGVELQEGYGTPYTATGLKGGFQCTSPQPSTLSGSSSIASTSSSSRRSGSSNLFSLLSTSSGGSRTSDEYSLDTQGHSPDEARMKNDEASLKRQSSSLILRTGQAADSGFTEFGPHTVIPQEEEKRKSVNSSQDRQEYQELSGSASRYRHDSDGGEDDDLGEGGSNVTIPKKARSRGWFSFNSSTSCSNKGEVSNNSKEDNLSTPKNERSNPAMLPAAGESTPRGSIADGQAASQQATTTTTTANSSATSSAKKTKQSASSKGMSMIRSAGRKRGDSEVSMKDMTGSMHE